MPNMCQINFVVPGCREPSTPPKAQSRFVCFRRVTYQARKGAYKLAAPRTTFFCTPFVARMLPPRSQKSGYGLLSGGKLSLDEAISCFDDVRKNGQILTGFSGPRSQSIGRGRISREGALDIRESRERRDKIMPKFSPEKPKKKVILA